jgi:hypothetical protein
MSSTSDSTKAVKQPQQIENIAPLAIGGELKYFLKVVVSTINNRYRQIKSLLAILATSAEP